MSTEDCKQQAAAQALELVTSGMRLGLGTGSTAVQITGAVIDDVAPFSLFQRTPQWIMPLVGKDMPVWTLNLGQYTDPCDTCDTAETNWQRPFLVIAVRRAAWGVNLGEALADALSSASNLPSTDRYSTYALTRYR